MKVFDLLKMTSYPYEEREKNVFYQAPEFKARIIDIPAGGQIPPCEMESHVLFYVIRGTAEVKVNGEETTMTLGQCMITEPATISMKTDDGVRLMGVQIPGSRQAS